MTDEQDDLTLVYAYGYKRGQDSMKAEIERLRDDNIALRELRAELILRALDESAAEIERLRAALRRIACDGEPYDKCHCVNSDECSYGIARAALGEKKDG